MRKLFGGAAIVAAFALLGVMTMGPDDEAAAPATSPVATARATPAPPPPEKHPPRAVDYPLVDARMKRLMAERGMVGLALGIVEDGQVTYLRGYGETAAGTGLPVTADTVFRWASVSKGLASTLVAGLAADGKLSLNDPIAKYTRSLRLAGGAEARARVSDVLTHRLGLSSNAQDPKLEDGGDPRVLRGELVALPPICPIGTCHAYQNVAYDAASELVEKVTGTAYGNVAAARVFKPLGMTSASVSLAGLVSAPSWAGPHDASGRPQPRGLSEAYYRVPAAGGVNSSVRDLARWMQAQMGETPRTLSPDLLRTIHAPRVATPIEERRQRKFRERIGNSHYGYGWRSYDYAGHRVVGHRGGVSGYRALVMFDPDRRSGVVALWNSSTGQPTGLEYEVMDMVYGLDRRDWLGIDGPPRPEPQPPRLAAATARAATDATGVPATIRAQMGR